MNLRSKRRLQRQKLLEVILQDLDGRAFDWMLNMNHCLAVKDMRSTESAELLTTKTHDCTLAPKYPKVVHVCEFFSASRRTTCGIKCLFEPYCVNP
jgi:hypothetical protein